RPRRPLCGENLLKLTTSAAARARPASASRFGRFYTATAVPAFRHAVWKSKNKSFTFLIGRKTKLCTFQSLRSRCVDKKPGAVFFNHRVSIARFLIDHNLVRLAAAAAHGRNNPQSMVRNPFFLEYFLYFIRRNIRNRDHQLPLSNNRSTQ